MADPWDEIYEKFDKALNNAHNVYWVGENFDGRSEFNCGELTFKEFLNKITNFYDLHNPKKWNRDIKKLKRTKILFIEDMINDRLNGINKWRYKLGHRIDERMQEIITREADATKDSKFPKKYLTFVTTRIPSTGFIARKRNITDNQAAEQIRDKILGSKYTTQEWYDMYKDLHRQAYLSEKAVEELILPENAHRKDYGQDLIKQSKNKSAKSKPSTPTKKEKKYNLKVYDEDTIPYPFKSKIKQYRKQEPDVPFVEVPKQDRVKYAKVERPYFSSERGAWEIDHCFNMAKPGDSWMFCINVNTRYLVVYEIGKDVNHVITSLKELAKNHLVKSIRGDGESGYCPIGLRNRVYTPENLKEHLKKSKHHTLADINESYEVPEWAMKNDITIYFNSSPFTLHNKIIDVAIKTIRNAIGYRILKPGQLQQIVDYYNDTVHKSIGCTPKEMHKDPELEYQYIRWCERKLGKVLEYQKDHGYLDYQPGNIIMVHIDTGKTAEKMTKRRVFYDRLAEFIGYEYGNVKCKLFVGVLIHSNNKKNKKKDPYIYEVTVPIYHTKFVAKNKESIPKNVADYYVQDAYTMD